MSSVSRDIWEEQKQISDTLSVWAVLNILSGTFLQLFHDHFWRGFGIQSSSWGFINGLIAAIGKRITDKRRMAMIDPETADVHNHERENLLRILLINSGLDVVYMMIGAVLIKTKGKGNRWWSGQGSGIIFQGLFLFVFDLVHAVKIGSTKD